MCRNKVCFKCGETKPITEFYKHNKMADGYLNKCKTCAKLDTTTNRNNNLDFYRNYDRERSYGDRVKVKQLKAKEKYHSDDEYRAKVIASRNKSSLLNHNKKNSNTRLGNAIRDGLVKKVEYCQFCNSNNSIHAHHWNYSNTYVFDVIWLCSKCHGLEHRRINQCKRDSIDPYLYGKEHSLYDLLEYCQTLKFDPFKLK